MITEVFFITEQGTIKAAVGKKIEIDSGEVPPWLTDKKIDKITPLEGVPRALITFKGTTSLMDINMNFVKFSFVKGD